MLLRRPSRVIVANIANTTGSYSSGQQVGAAVQLKNAVEASGGTATLVSVAVLDPSKSDQPLDIYFFSAQPTPAADKAAAAFSAADLLNCLGTVTLSTYKDLSANSVATLTNIGLKLQALKTGVSNSAPTTVWACVVARGTNTYTVAATLNIAFGIDSD